MSLFSTGALASIQTDLNVLDQILAGKVESWPQTREALERIRAILVAMLADG